MVKSRINACDIYIVLWLLYSMQSVLLRGVGGYFSITILLLLVFVSGYHMIKTLTESFDNKYLRSLFILLVLFTIYGTILILSGQTIRFRQSGNVYSNFDFLKKIFISLLPIYSFYYFSRKKMIDEKRIVIWAIVFLVSAIVMFLYYQSRAILLADDEDYEFTNNQGYLILALLPIIPLLGKRLFLQYTYLAICFVFIVLGIKRGAILAGTLCAIWFIWTSLKTVSKRQRNWLLFLSIVFVSIGVFVVIRMLNESVYFSYRVQQTLEGNTSGRDKLYRVLWHHFLEETNLLKILIGNGANSTLTFATNFAHNDWLEILINHGLVGVVIYLIYWIQFYKTWRRSRYNSRLYLSIGMVFIIFFLESVFSMSYNAMPIYSTFCLGYCLGSLNNETKVLKSY